MISWILFFLIITAALVAGNCLGPAEHRKNYQQCRKPGIYWVSACCSLSIPIVAGIQNLIAPGDFPVWLKVVGVAYMVAGYALQIWAWRVNYFLLPIVVYIPHDFRVTSGPYRFCPHPFYYGVIFAAIGSAFLLGQWWALYPMMAYALLINYRMVVEDRILSKHPSL